MENAIRNLINFAKKSSGSHRRIVLSAVTEKQLEAYKMKGISDIDSDFVHSMGSSSLIHYGHRHKNDNRGQMPLTNEEMVNIIDVIEDFDEVEKGGLTNTGLNTILYKKDMGDGTIVYVEEVRTGRKSLAFKTAYKKRN